VRPARPAARKLEDHFVDVVLRSEAAEAVEAAG